MWLDVGSRAKEIESRYLVVACRISEDLAVLGFVVVAMGSHLVRLVLESVDIRLGCQLELVLLVVDIRLVACHMNLALVAEEDVRSRMLAVVGGPWRSRADFRNLCEL